jgi:hypothetical protein
MHTSEVARLAGKYLAQPGDLFALSGKALSELLDPETGNVDPELVEEAAQEILSGRPGLRPNVAAIDPTQGHGGSVSKGPISWADLFKS